MEKRTGFIYLFIVNAEGFTVMSPSAFINYKMIKIILRLNFFWLYN